MRNLSLLGCIFASLAFASSVQAREYNLVIDETVVYVTGNPVAAMAINGQIPGPLLRFKEGEDVTIHVTNRLSQPASIHWHGILIPPGMDGVPGFNGFPGIMPGETFTYRFTPRQSGTYWYHSHFDLQEQAGLYGPMIIEPKDGEVLQTDRDYVVMLSDFSAEAPGRILRNLKADPGYYNRSRRTVFDFFRDAGREGLGATISDRLAWGEMRMDPTDLADVSGYVFLANGKPPGANETFLFKPYERVRLRFIDGSAMTIFDVKIPGLKMAVVQADGQNVKPVPVDDFRFAPGETYDVIVTPDGEGPYTIFAQSLDRTGYARATLAMHEGLSGEIPAMSPRALLTMADMGMSDMAGMDHAGMEGMESMPGMPGMSGMSMPGMDHGDMAGMDHGAMAGADELPDEPGKPALGWGAGFPKGDKVLAYADLRAATPNADLRAPGREIVIHLTGNMERFIWTIDGKSFQDSEPFVLEYGERVLITFVNETMMAHPMHLHGMFVELVNGQPAENRPRKHVVTIAPGQTYSVMLTANEVGEWAIHCHLLYHMVSGMMAKFIVLPPEKQEAAR